MGISAINVTKSFGTPPVQAISNVSLEIKSGEFVSLIGKSGSGKSTLLYLLSSLDIVTEGQVLIDGKDILQMTKNEIYAFRNQNMGFVFQFHYLISELSAMENVLLPCFKEKTVEQHRQFAKELLDRFGLNDKYDRLPSQLSGGEQQRVAIARALVMKPRYLFADEPTGSLDTANGKIVMDILKNANQDYKTTIIMVTHDVDYASLAERRIELQDGRILTH